MKIFYLELLSSYNIYKINGLLIYNFRCTTNIGKVIFLLHIAPPPCIQNCFRNSLFFAEWSKWLNDIASIPYDVIITGDLNFHLDNKSNVEARRFCSILDSHGLTQQVNRTTHKEGYTIDLVISRESSSIIVGAPSVFDPCLSSDKGKSFGDHLAVQFVWYHMKFTYRRFCGINVKEIMEDIQLSKCEGAVDELVKAYYKRVQSFINHHAPSCSKIITWRLETPWYSNNLRSAKKICRKEERIWHWTSLTFHFEIYSIIFYIKTYYWRRRSVSIPQR